MPARSRSGPDSPSSPPADDDRAVSVLQSRPGKLVFVEEGNADGWIATEDAVALHE